MKRRFKLPFPLSIFLLGSIAWPISGNAQQLSFRGNTLPILEETPERNTGLDKIYIAYDIKNVEIIYSSSSPRNVEVLKYSNLGGGYAEKVTNLDYENNYIIIKNSEGNIGYIIEDSDKRYYFWIVNYLPYRFDISSIEKNNETDCDATLLNITGSGEPIHYFTINGQQRTLNREIKVIFDTQEWQESAREFERTEVVKYYESLNNPLRIVPPAYCSTAFTIEGDKFLSQWNWSASAESSVIDPTAVMIMTEAIQDNESDDNSDNSKSSKKRQKNIIKGVKSGNRSKSTKRNISRADEEIEPIDPSDPSDSDITDSGAESGNDKVPSNEINSGNDGLGGSAPANITFTAYVTEGVLHHEWQLTTDPNFEDIEYRFNQQSIDYTFTQEGTFYMRYIGSNYDGSCEVVGETYTIKIGASELKCPNAFTPDGDGINDEWKVSYRSLLSFKCWIFDRYGNQIFYFDDPSQGWDGTRGGKLVGPGVYYYVIQAEGADGERYKKSGDINILRHRSASSGSEAIE